MRSFKKYFTKFFVKSYNKHMETRSKKSATLNVSDVYVKGVASRAVVNRRVKKDIKRANAQNTRTVLNNANRVAELIDLPEELQDNLDTWREVSVNVKLDVQSKTEIVDTDSDIMLDVIDDIKALPGKRYDKFNIQVYDIEPENIEGFYSRSLTTGGLIESNGNPIIIWSYYARMVANIIHAILKNYGYQNGSFWSIQLLAHESGRVVSTSFGTTEQTVESITEIVENLRGTYQTSEGLEILRSTWVRVVVGNPGTGRGGTLPSHLSKTANWSPPDDGYCAPMAILMATSTGKTREHLKSRHTYLLNRTKELCDSIALPDTPSWNFEYVKQAAAVLEIRIIVLDPYTKVVLGDFGDGTKTYIYYDNVQQHYIACLKNPSADSPDKQWCDSCLKLHPRKGFKSHVCQSYKCYDCNTTFNSSEELNTHHAPLGEQSFKICDICNKSVSANCHPEHVLSCDAKSIKCPKCKETYINKEQSSHYSALYKHEHDAICGLKHKYCMVCRKHCGKGHTCVIPKVIKRYSHEKDKRKLAVFDIECTRGSDGKQTPCFISVRWVPKSLQYETKDQYISRLTTYYEDTPPLEFMGESCLNDFCVWASRQKLTDIVAHNLKGYDGVIIHHYMRYEMRIQTDPIFVGLKVMAFRFASNRMIDSLNHVPISLAKFPDAMDIKLPNISKGYFPHLFNTAENSQYVGPHPDISYYEPDKMSVIDRHEFKLWYYAQKGVYDIQRTIREYCHQDTYILALCFGEYRRGMIEINEIDPTKHITISSYCLAVYQMHSIPAEGIPILSRYEADFARQGFQGGRTEVFKSRAGFKKDKLKMIDVVSMYPTVQYYDNMPYGKPIIYKHGNIPSNWLDISGTEGFAKIDFKAPNDLYIPLLGGYDDNGKLVFDTRQHIQQVVTLTELRKAREIGYTLTNVTEVHLYVARNDLFKDYVRRFLKVKVQSSTPPSDPLNFIKLYKDKFDIQLDEEKLIEPKNEGMRTLSKQCLVSLWGKLGQSEHAVSELCDPEKYFKLMARFIRKEIEITSVEVDTQLDDCVCVKYYEKQKIECTALSKTNAAIAAYVTAQARLRLYKVIGDTRLQHRVCYCDTDSAIYIIDDAGFNPTEGNLLGDWEPEAIFDDFAATGPKAYACMATSKHEHYYKRLTAALQTNSAISPDIKAGLAKSFKLRVKGFKPSGHAERLFTMDSIIGSIDGSGPITVPTTLFTRSNGTIHVVESEKVFEYKPADGKRKVIPGSYNLAPY